VTTTQPVTGKRIRRSTKCKDKRDAQKVAREIEDDLRKEGADTKAGKQPVSLGEALNSYVMSLEGAKKASAGSNRVLVFKLLGTSTNVKMAGRFHLDTAMFLHDLTPVMVANLITARQLEGSGAQTICHEVKLLRATCRRAKRLRLLSPDIDKWEMPKVIRKTRYLSFDEWQRLYDHLDPHRPIAPGLSMKGNPRASYTLPDGCLRVRQRQDVQDLLVALSLTGGRWTEVSRLT
jgi:hypothetical protein